MSRTYGHVDGVAIGDVFLNRKKLGEARVHGPLQAGIWGGQDGSESIVLNGGYVDDEDRGPEVIYTGEGGNDPITNQQVADQELSRGNLGLVVACNQGFPVRVTRGPKCDSPYACKDGFRYDGLYRVDNYWHDEGIDGFLIYRFLLVAIPGDSRFDSPDHPTAGNENPGRVAQTTLRIIRDTVLSRTVKEKHDYRCQVCDEQIPVAGGFYAEAAHIRPLGKPHDGPDTTDNILCLCPNHHVMFDRGSIWIDDAFTVQPNQETLRRKEINPPSRDHTRYHREHIGSEKGS